MPTTNAPTAPMPVRIVYARSAPDEAYLGAILTVGRDASARSVDKTIAAYAARHDGFYEPKQHLQIVRATGRVPGGDIDGHIEAHVRRLEALRRAGIAQRLDADLWRIPPDSWSGPQPTTRGPAATSLWR